MVFNMIKFHKVNKLKKIIRSNPQNSFYYESLGLLYDQQLHLPYLAIKYINKAISHDPLIPDYYHDKYSLEKRIGNITGEIKCLEHIVTMKPNDDSRYNLLGKLYLKRGLHNDAKYALHYFNIALNMNNEKDNPHYLFNAAKAELLLGDYVKSLNYAKGACDPIDNPDGIADCVKLFNKRGIDYGNHGNNKESEKCYKNALSIDKQQPVLYYNLARSYEGQGRIKEAIQTAKESFKIKPDYGLCKKLITRLKSSNKSKDMQRNQRTSLDYNPNIDYSAKLKNLIGLNTVKNSIHTYLNRSIIHKIRRNKPGHGEIHLILEGNPGTGKSTVAKLLCAILYQKHIIDKPNFVMVHSTQLVYRHYGESAQHVRKAIHRAMGGVLFIDEAYHLMHKSDNNSACEDEAVAELLPDIEKYRNKIVVIMAGYTDVMEKFLNKSNRGLGSRFPNRIKFPDYNNQECIKIMDKYLSDNHFTIKSGATKRLLNKELSGYLSANRSDTSHVFSNARTVRNLYAKITDAFANRLMKKYTRRQLRNSKKLNSNLLNTITASDIKLGFKKYNASKSSKSAVHQLHDLIGLKDVKSIITSAVNQVIVHKVRTGDNQHDSMNMVFEGNPGTGKTTVAKLFCKILYEKGVTKSSNYVYVSAASLAGKLVGESAENLQKVVKRAMNGVLFIDEAYELANNNNQPIVNQLISDVSKYKNKLVIILAGYPKAMEELMTHTNAGLSSRFPNRVQFPNYSMRECHEILQYDFRKAGLTINSRQSSRLLNQSFDRYINAMREEQSTFANARTVNNYFLTLKQCFANRLCTRSIANLKALEKRHSRILSIVSVKDIQSTSQKLQKNIKHLGTPSIGFGSRVYHSSPSLNN